MKINHPQTLFGRFSASCAGARGRSATALALFVAIFSSSAYGADYSTPAPLPDYFLRGSDAPVSHAPVFPRWDGFYFGGQLGQSFGSADFSNGNTSQVAYILANTELAGTVPTWTTLPKGSSATQSYGGFIGYNLQWGEVVTGAELNYNHMAFRIGAADSIGPIQVPGANLPDGSTVLYNITVASSASVAIHDILTARARVGWTYDRLLPYGFVGLAVGRADVAQTASVTGTKTTTTPGSPPVVDGPNVLLLPRNPQTQSQNGLIAYGYAAGLGVDVGLTQNLFLRAEWEFVQFPHISDFRVSMNSVRAAVGLKF
jgi:outer membrane immunogenic protein